MPLFGVSVDCVTPKWPKTSTSGIRICDHLVLTHSAIVWNLLKESLKESVQKNVSFILVEQNVKKLQSLLTNTVLESNSKFTVVQSLESCKCNSHQKNLEKLDSSSSEEIEKPTISSLEAFIEGIIISPHLLLELLNLLYNRDEWKFNKCDKTEEEIDHDLENIYLSTFILLRTKDGGNPDNCLMEFEKSLTIPRKGTTLFIDGCPFGCESARSIFLNSISKGIVSNVSSSGSIILTDARCIIGCEGAPAYVLEYRFNICGIVLSPFCWLKGEWIGLTFLAALKPLVAYTRTVLTPSDALELYPVATCSSGPLLSLGDPRSCLRPDDETLSCEPSSIVKEARLMPEMVNAMTKSIVRVSCRGSVDWGTGVVVQATQGLVVTCSHVTKPARDQEVDVFFWDGTTSKGIVIFESRPCLGGDGGPHEEAEGETHFDLWDLAIIKLSSRPTHFLPLSKDLPVIGTPVLIGGHPIFRAEVLPAPTFSLGNLAKVVAVPERLLPLSKHPTEHHSPWGPSLNEGLVCPAWQHHSLHDKLIPMTLQTTCAVYSGVSGGPVVALHPAKGPIIIGIVSCCVRDVSNNVNFPHVNLSTPTFLLTEAIERFNITSGTRTWKRLDIKLNLFGTSAPRGDAKYIHLRVGSISGCIFACPTVGTQTFSCPVQENWFVKSYNPGCHSTHFQVIKFDCRTFSY